MKMTKEEIELKYKELRFAYFNFCKSDDEFKEKYSNENTLIKEKVIQYKNTSFKDVNQIAEKVAEECLNFM